MLDYTKIIDLSKAFNMMQLDAKSGRSSHTYLFLSSDENYLKQFAEMVASLLINLSDGANAENNSMRIKNHVLPEVKFYGDDKPIVVETVSEIIDAANYSPYEADKKIFVLSNIQDMNEASQNKILKTIEEPTDSTYFLLTANQTSSVLSTVLSRSKQVELDALTTSQISQMLEAAGVSKNDAEIFANCSNQNASFAEKLATNRGFIELFENIISCFHDIQTSRDVIDFSAIFSSKSVDKDEFLNICLCVIRDLEMILAGKPELASLKNSITKLKMIASSLNLNAVQILAQTCIEAKQDLSQNVSATAVVDKILFKIAEVKVKCRKLLA